MRTDPSLDHLDADLDHDPEADALALLSHTMRMVAVVEALVKSHRQVDIRGLHDQVGLVCAKALDLPATRTGLLKLELRRLAASLDTLSTTLREHAA